MKTKFKKSLALLLSILMLIGMIPSMSLASSALDPTDTYTSKTGEPIAPSTYDDASGNYPGQTKQGYAYLNKSAKWLAGNPTDPGYADAIAEVTFKVRGTPVVSPIDVMLVLDVSSSMVNNKDGTATTRLEKMKEAAQLFIDKIYAGNPNNRVGVTIFTGTTVVADASTYVSAADPTYNAAATLSDFVGSSGKTLLKTKVATLGNGTGTQISMGLSLGQKLINARGDKTNTPLMVLLTDGQPYDDIHNPDITSPDNATAGIVKAGQIKAAGIPIYTIAIGEATKTYTDSVASDPDSQYSFECKTDPSALSATFEKIASNMTLAGSNANLMDYVNTKYFEIYEDGHPVASNGNGNVTVNTATDTVSWKVGDITDAMKTLTFQIQLKPEYREVRGRYPTNAGTANLTYTNYKNNPSTIAVVTPELWRPGTTGIVDIHYYQVNDNGEPVEYGDSGTVIPFASRSSLGDVAFTDPVTGSSVLDPGDYSVTAPLTITYGGNTYYYEPLSSGKSGNPTTAVGGVATAHVVAGGVTEIFFGYSKSPRLQVRYDGNGNTSGTPPVDGTLYKNGSTVTVLGKNDLVRLGYDFAGWNTNSAGTGTSYSESSTFTITANTTLYAKWTPRNDTKYTVEHYLQKEPGSSDYVIDTSSTETLAGTTGSTVTAVPKTFPGYVENTAHPLRKATGVVAGDGSLVLKLFYQRGAVGYKVEHYLQNVAGNKPLTTYRLADTDTLSGTFGATVTATPKTYAGYTENTTHPLRIASGTVNAAGTLVLKLYYDANRDTAYKVEHYQQRVVGGVVVDPTDYKLIDTVDLTGITHGTATVTSKTYAGFKYVSSKTTYQDSAHPASTTVLTIAGDGTLVVKLYYDWDSTGKKTNYKVQHYLQNLTTGSYDLKDTDELLANTGDVVTAVPKTYPGYTENTTHPSRIASGTVDPAGSLVLKLYYDASETAYKVEHYQQTIDGIGGPGAGYTLIDTDNLTGLTGAAPVLTPKTYAGFKYISAKTTYEDSAHPASRTVLTIAGDGTLIVKMYYDADPGQHEKSYTVEHIKRKSGGEELADREYFYGNTGTVVTATPKTYPGYTYDTSSVNTGTVLADGSLVIKLYYDPAPSTYKVEYYQQKVVNNTVPNPNDYIIIETESLTGNTDDVVTATPKSYAGFVENTLIPSRVASGTVLGDGSLVLKLYYDKVPAPNPPDPMSYNYKVEHYKQNMTLSGYDIESADTEYLVANTGTTVIAVPKSYAGFTYNDTMSAATKSGVITAAGGLVLKLYYDRSADCTYRIEYYKQNAIGSGYALAESETKSDGVFGKTVTITADPDRYPGYALAASGHVLTGVVDGAGNPVLKVYYDTSSVNYKIEYYYYEGDLYVKHDAETETKSGTAGTLVTATPKIVVGYTYNSSKSTVSGTVLADGSLVLKLYYDPSTNTKYKVEHYKEDVTDYKLAETETLYGTTGSAVTATPKTYVGYELSTTHAQEDSGTIAGDGSLVLKLYYDKAGDITYKIVYGQQVRGTSYKYTAGPTIYGDLSLTTTECMKYRKDTVYATAKYKFAEIVFSNNSTVGGDDKSSLSDLSPAPVSGDTVYVIIKYNLK